MPLSNTQIKFLEVAREVVVRYPDIENRRYSIGRKWDMLHYLLSAKRRKNQHGTRSDIVERAIVGGDGSEICRYMAAQEVKQVAELLDDVSHDNLREQFHYAHMIELGVYKSWQMPEDEHRAFERLYEVFVEFRDFYQSAAKHGEAVLCSIG